MQIFAVGSYTRNARGEGITVISLGDEGSMAVVSSRGGIVDPSYLAWDPATRLVYASSEGGARGSVSTWQLTGKGTLESGTEIRGTAQSYCHVTLVPSRKIVAAASYADGRIDILGSLIPCPAYAGNGPNRTRQETPHAHQTAYDPVVGNLLAVDLGTDTLWSHDLDRPGAPPVAVFHAPAGYGPRHLVLDPDGIHAFLVCELVPKLLVLRRSADGWGLVEEHGATSPGARVSAPAAVKIHPSGRSVALSSRFDDTVAVFGINRDKDGTVRGLGEAARFDAGGKTPRDIEFSPDGRWLLVAHQDSSTLISFGFDPDSAKPTGAHGPKLGIGAPACIVALGAAWAPGLQCVDLQ